MTHSSIHKVLIADDNEVFSHSVERHLKREGFEVFVAHDGNTAKSMVLAAESDGHPFDLVVAEFFMPNMQGVDLVRWLHQHFPALSVLMVSGFGNIDLMNNVIRPDIDASLKKPVLPVQIMLTIAMIAVKRQYIGIPGGALPQQGM
jgi:DNA-binding response OmpR family regulator